MLYERKPPGFSPINNVSGCFCEFGGEILLLKRREDKLHANKWGLPGGKANPGETPKETVIRETKEETGIDVGAHGVRLFRRTFIRYPEGDFIYDIFQSGLQRREPVVLSTEHIDYAWATPLRALQMDLILDLDACINMLYVQSGQIGLAATLDTPQGL